SSRRRIAALSRRAARGRGSISDNGVRGKKMPSTCAAGAAKPNLKLNVKRQTPGIGARRGARVRGRPKWQCPRAGWRSGNEFPPDRYLRGYQRRQRRQPHRRQPHPRRQPQPRRHQALADVVEVVNARVETPTVVATWVPMLPTAYVASTATMANERTTIALAFAGAFPAIDFTPAFCTCNFHSNP